MANPFNITITAIDKADTQASGKVTARRGFADRF
jgi:hypothetical protein